MSARADARAWFQSARIDDIDSLNAARGIVAALLAEADALAEKFTALEEDCVRARWGSAVREKALQQTIDDLEATYTQQVSDLRGQVAAQDTRERDAGLKCSVLWEESGCDWPDTVAERVLHLRKERGALAAALRKCSDMLSAVAGDMEDGGSLETLRGKYVSALVECRDDARRLL